MQEDRRQFLKSGGILLSVAVGANFMRLTPAAAKAAGAPYLVLSKEEVGTLEGLAEAAVPGASKAGIAHFVDKQLAASPQDSLLMLKYLGVPEGDYLSFYQGGLRSAAQLAEFQHGKGWPELGSDEAGKLVAEIAAEQAKDWSGPPAPFFFFVIRSDACDVVYGTEQGFASIAMPYMAHITPPEPW